MGGVARAQGPSSSSVLKIDQLIAQDGTTPCPAGFAHFGFTTAAGPLFGSPNDPNALDDVVLSAKDDPSDCTPFALPDIGALYVYQATGGTPPLSTQGVRLLPGKADAGQDLGARGIAVGRLRPTDDFNLVFAGAPLRDIDVTRQNIGAVDAWKIRDNATPGTSVFGPSGLLPPSEPGSNPPAPMPHQLLGHAIALGDLDGDGMKELIVSAHGANGHRGRVYVYWGSSNHGFGLDLSLADQKITVIEPPPVDPVFAALGLQGCHQPTGDFGFALAVGDLDGDGTRSDLVIGEPNYPSQVVPCPGGGTYGGSTRVGRVHVYRGAQIPKPAAPVVEFSGALPQLTLVPPAHLNVGTSPPQEEEFYGFYLFVLDYDADGKLDLVVHGENTDFPATPPVPKAGALYCYRNVSSTAGSLALESDSARRPSRWLYSDDPKQGARYGKWAGTGRWRLSVQDPYVDAALFGEPDQTVNGVRRSGRVLVNFATTIDLAPAFTPHALSPDAHIQSDLFDFSSDGGPGSGTSSHEMMEFFGRWFVIGNFSDPSTTQKRDLVITASGRTAWSSNVQYTEGGAALVVRAK